MEENPYAAPTAPPQALAESPLDLPGLDDRAVKRLRNHSHSIRSSVVLIALGIAGLTIGANFVAPGAAGNREWMMALGLIVLSVLLGIAAMIGLIRRPGWGRVVGMVVSGMMILTVSLASLLGILLLIALIQSRPLFGPDRITHREIESEWKTRRQRRREEKRRAKLERAA